MEWRNENKLSFYWLNLKRKEKDIEWNETQWNVFQINDIAG